MDAYRVAFNTWQEKTKWVQKDKRFDFLLPWGKHRADVLKEYIDHLEAKCAALASPEAEPVAYLTNSTNMTEVITAHSFGGNSANMHSVAKHCNWTPLFIATPAQVSVPDERPSLNNGIVGFDEGWNACRDAMLQGADGNSPVIADGWVACSERLPEVGEIVLTSDGTSINLGESERSGVNLRFFTSIFSGRELPATHWMPLPAAPRQE